MARWRVDIIRSRAEHLGVVEAANEQEAIEKGGQNLTVENGSFSENPGDGVIGGNGLSATATGLFFQFSLADFSTIVFPTTGFLCFEDASVAYSGVLSTISINLPGDPQSPMWESETGNFQIATAASAVPEPSTWAMMLLGFAGLGFAFRQSRRKVSFA
jgi:hypothetical protein